MSVYSVGSITLTVAVLALQDNEADPPPRSTYMDEFGPSPTVTASALS